MWQAPCFGSAVGLNVTFVVFLSCFVLPQVEVFELMAGRFWLLFVLVRVSWSLVACQLLSFAFLHGLSLHNLPCEVAFPFWLSWEKMFWQ